MKLDYLSCSKDAQVRDRILRALDRLNSNDDFQCIKEFLLQPSIQNAMMYVSMTGHDDRDLPVYQGVVRVLSELMAEAKNARASLEMTPTRKTLRK